MTPTVLIYPQLVTVLLFLCHAHEDGVQMAKVVKNPTAKDVSIAPSGTMNGARSAPTLLASENPIVMSRALKPNGP